MGLYQFAITIIIAISAVIMPQFGASAAWAENLMISNPELTVIYEKKHEKIARDILRMYPHLMSEIEHELRRATRLVPKPKVALVGEKKFRKMRVNKRVVAFARSRGNIIAINVTRMANDLDDTLKHELVHLVLGAGGSAGYMPRWLNEGVAQMLSNGASEIANLGKSTTLGHATLFEKLIPLKLLETSFPQNEKQMELAYQEGRSMTEYIDKRFGRQRLLNVVSSVIGGTTINRAISDALGLSYRQLELDWRLKLKTRHTLVTYLSSNIYMLLFLFAALITIIGFVRVIWRIKTYRDDEETGLPYDTDNYTNPSLDYRPDQD